MDSEIKKKIEAEIDSLRTLRDELQVQVRLGAAEAKDAWEGAEKRWNHLEGRLKVLADATQEAADDVGDAVRLLVDEIRDGYHDIRKLI